MARAIGKTASLTATTEVPVNGTTYTEQTSGAQRSVVSSSASDTGAGTGAQKVRIVYYTLASDGTIKGPFSEIVTLNGATAVATANSDIALIEKLEVVNVGSGGASAGTISLKAASDGTGATIASIATGDPQAWLCHHYVASSKQCLLDDVEFVGGNASAANFELKLQKYPAANFAELAVTGQIAAGTGGVAVAFKDLGPIAGPARIRAYVAPANSTAQVEQASFGYREVKVILDQ